VCSRRRVASVCPDTAAPGRVCRAMASALPQVSLPAVPGTGPPAAAPGDSGAAALTKGTFLGGSN